MKSSTKVAAVIIGAAILAAGTGITGYQMGANSTVDSVSSAHAAGVKDALCQVSRDYPQPPVPYKTWECVWPEQVSNATLLERTIENKCVCG